MTTTISVEPGKIFINNFPLDELFKQVYEKGREDAIIENSTEKITLQQLQKELLAKGRKVSVQTLTRKAREAKVKVFAYDGKRNGVYRKDIKQFISI